MNARHIVILILLVICLVPLQAFGESRELSDDLVIFHAGSLSVPFKMISDEFTKIHPNVKIYRESAGSRACARKITDLHQEADIMASADYTVIDKLLIPEFADWDIRFASNEMAIVYHKGSKGASEINSDNWYHILMRDDVVIGRSDPNADPCGYRAVLTMKLAEKHYGINGLAAKMIAKDNEYIRPKETDLLALLESGAIDYIFLYRSVAEQHKLDFVLLPDHINLKKPELTEYYATASVDISGKEPGTFITKIGEPMVYGVTIPKNAPNPEAALAFVKFLLTKNQGMAIMEELGQPSMVPSFTDTYDKLPGELKDFALAK